MSFQGSNLSFQNRDPDMGLSLIHLKPATVVTKRQSRWTRIRRLIFSAPEIACCEQGKPPVLPQVISMRAAGPICQQCGVAGPLTSKPTARCSSAPWKHITRHRLALSRGGVYVSVNRVNVYNGCGYSPRQPVVTGGSHLIGVRRTCRLEKQTQT